MKTLKQLITDWLNINQEAHTARINYFQKRHDLLLMLTEIKMEKSSILMSDWDDSDKGVITEFYNQQIDKCNNELYWLDLFYDLKIGS